MNFYLIQTNNCVHVSLFQHAVAMYRKGLPVEILSLPESEKKLKDFIAQFPNRNDCIMLLSFNENSYIKSIEFAKGFRTKVGTLPHLMLIGTDYWQQTREGVFDSNIHYINRVDCTMQLLNVISDPLLRQSTNQLFGVSLYERTTGFCYTYAIPSTVEGKIARHMGMPCKYEMKRVWGGLIKLKKITLVVPRSNLLYLNFQEWCRETGVILEAGKKYGQISDVLLETAYAPGFFSNAVLRYLYYQSSGCPIYVQDNKLEEFHDFQFIKHVQGYLAIKKNEVLLSKICRALSKIKRFFISNVHSKPFLPC